MCYPVLSEGGYGRVKIVGVGVPEPYGLASTWKFACFIQTG